MDNIIEIQIVCDVKYSYSNQGPRCKFLSGGGGGLFSAPLFLFKFFCLIYFLFLQKSGGGGGWDSLVHI